MKHRLRFVPVVALLALIFWAVEESCVAEAIPVGVGQFTFVDHAGDPAKPIEVYYYKPENAAPDTPVWFIMHGNQRNADTYRDNWIDIGETHGIWIIAPQFSEEHYPGSAGYNLGNVTDRRGRPVPRSRWSFAVIDHLFDQLRRHEGIEREGYTIFGHSAGAQFVHRLVMFVPEAKIELAISANAGWYTMPSFVQAFPYGLSGTAMTPMQLRRALPRPLVILLGEQDTDPNHRHLRRAREAMQQGEHRFARGHSFIAEAERMARQLNVTLGWKKQIVPGVGHSNAQMAAAAASAFIDEQ